MAANTWTQKPKGYVTIALIAILFLASAAAHDFSGVITSAIAVAAAAATDVLWGWIAHRKKIYVDGAIITGLIIGLILSTTTSWQVIALTSIIAILSKHILVARKKPIFNPAAFGLLWSIPLFSTQQSWWGAFGDSPAWMMAFLLIGGCIVVERINKFPQVFAFLGTYFIMLFFMNLVHIGDAYDALHTPFINAALFCSMFMLTDPPTSPGRTRHQIIFGILSALTGMIIYARFGGLMYLFIGLMIGNLYQAVVSKVTAASKRTRVSSSRSRAKTAGRRSFS